jgi:hypothetical protein
MMPETRITRIRSTPFVSDELKNIFFSKFWLDMEVGLGKDGVPTWRARAAGNAPLV